jgi:hypothetical protein
MSVTSFQLSWQALSKEDHSLVAVLMWNVAESVLDFSGMKYTTTRILQEIRHKA